MGFSAATGTAGCLADGGSPGESGESSRTGEPSDSDAEWNADGSHPDLAVETGLAGPDRTESAAFEGSVVQQPTATDPPTVHLAFRNVGNESVDVQIPDPYPWRNYSDRPHDDSVLHLLPHETEHLSAGVAEEPPERWVPEEPTDGCWRSSTETRPRWPDVGYPTVTLGPNEAVGGEFVVLSSLAREECFPDGAYEFPDDAATVDPDGDAVELALHLTIVVGSST